MVIAMNLSNKQPAPSALNGAPQEDSTDNNDALALLKALANNHPAHIKLGKRLSVNRNIADFPMGIHQAAKFLTDYRGKHFFSCATSQNAPFTGLDELLALAVACSFATAEEEDITRLILTKFTIPPNAIIRTDGYLHPLWFLSNRHDITNQKYRSRAERIHGWLAEKLSAQTLAPDAWIPLPGDEGVELELFDEVPRYNITDFEQRDFDLYSAACDDEESTEAVDGPRTNGLAADDDFDNDLADNQQADAVGSIEPDNDTETDDAVASASSAEDEYALSIGQYRVHPAAAVFPLMEGEEFDSLVAHITDNNGLIRKIVQTRDGRIVDGRNRLRACIAAGIEPEFETLDPAYDHDENARINYVVGENIERRHLDAAQRAAIGAELELLYRPAAKERQREHGGTAPGRPKETLRAFLPEVNGSHAPTTRERIAKKVGVSDGSIMKALKIKHEAPDLLPKVKNKEKSLDEAYREASERAKAKALGPKPAASQFIRVNKAVSPLAAWHWELATDGESAPLLDTKQLNAPANTRLTENVRTELALAKARRRRAGLERETRVLVSPSYDLYGPGVTDQIITSVHAACAKNSRWRYLLVTHFPQRLAARKDIPPSAWVGAKVETQEDLAPAEEAFRKIKGGPVKWLWIEPHEQINFSVTYGCFDMVFVTAQPEAETTAEQALQFTPSFKWLAFFYVQANGAGCAVFFAPDLRERMVLPQEEPRSKSLMANK
jgi:hypothetical protein